MKVFVTMVVIALVLGCALGGAFVFGVTFGKSRQEEPGPGTTLPTPTRAMDVRTAPGGPPAALDPQAIAMLEERVASGDMSPEEAAQVLQGMSMGGGLALQAGQPELVGTIENIEGDVVTIMTPYGPITASVSAETAVHLTSEGTTADLEPGMTVTIDGQPRGDGGFAVTSVLVMPEGAPGAFGGGAAGGQ